MNTFFKYWKPYFQEIGEIKKQGNSEFQKQNFSEAISRYTNAIAFEWVE